MNTNKNSEPLVSGNDLPFLCLFNNISRFSSFIVNVFEAKICVFSNGLFLENMVPREPFWFSWILFGFVAVFFFFVWFVCVSSFSPSTGISVESRISFDLVTCALFVYQYISFWMVMIIISLSWNCAFWSFHKYSIDWNVQWKETK